MATYHMGKGQLYCESVRDRRCPFSAMLKQARKQRRMTLKQVAAKAGISAFAVFALENDPKDPALRTVFKLANFYGIPLDKLAAVLFPGDAVKDAK